MKYQVIEISEYLINTNGYETVEEALTCFKAWIEDANEYPALRIKKIYLTIGHGIAAEWDNRPETKTG